MLSALYRYVEHRSLVRLVSGAHVLRRNTQPRRGCGFHAVSIDERRKEFLLSLWKEGRKAPGQANEQVWFSECHSDVGGSCAESKLSDIALQWMLEKAEAQGLRLENTWCDSLDPDPSGYLREALTGAGYAALATGDPAELSRIIRSERPDLVLLDLVLRGTDGLSLLGSVPELADLPVVFISGYGRDETIAEALKAGAADYLVKPFSPTELTARVGAALRRVARPEPFALGELAIHYEERRVTVAGRQVELTAKEYELLRVLSLNAGRVVIYDVLLRRVWSGHDAGESTLVRNFVKKLRAKLGDDAQSPTWIFSVRGVGYRMASPRVE